MCVGIAPTLPSRMSIRSAIVGPKFGLSEPAIIDPRLHFSRKPLKLPDPGLAVKCRREKQTSAAGRQGGAWRAHASLKCTVRASPRHLICLQVKGRQQRRRSQMRRSTIIRVVFKLSQLVVSPAPASFVASGCVKTLGATCDRSRMGIALAQI